MKARRLARWLASSSLSLALVVGHAAAAEPAPKTGLPDALRDRALSGAPGCVAIDSAGQVLLAIAPEPEGTKLFLTLFDRKPDAGQDDFVWVPLAAGGPGAALSDDTIAPRIAGLRWKACHDIALKDGKAVVPREVPVELDGSGAHIAGNATVPWPSQDGEPASPEVAYWADGVGTMFVSLGGHMDAVTATELGWPACVPRPRRFPAAADEPAPRYDPAASKKGGCFAMSADGLSAGFVLDTSGGRNGMPERTTVWLGATAGQPIPEDKRVGCRATKTLRVADQAVPFVVTNHAIRLALPVFARGVWRLVDERMGSFHEQESVRKIFQLGRGPAFALLDFGGGMDMESGMRVAVIDEKAMNLCPADPPGTLPIAALAASSEAKPALGYTWPAIAANDGDLSTGWRPADPKGGKNLTPPWLELRLAAPARIAAIEIANGMQRKDGNGDHFAQGARVASANLSFSDGSSETISLPADARDFVRVQLSQVHTSDRVRIEVTATHKGSVAARAVSISEVRLVAEGGP